MSGDNLYEYAGDFENFFLMAGEYLDKNARTPLKHNDFEQIQDLLSKMEHC
jgi:hypothetical protein